EQVVDGRRFPQRRGESAAVEPLGQLREVAGDALAGLLDRRVLAAGLRSERAWRSLRCGPTGRAFDQPRSPLAALRLLRPCELLQPLAQRLGVEPTAKLRVLPDRAFDQPVEQF